MRNKTLILLALSLCLLSTGVVLGQPTNTTFSFTLPSTAITSAGVYNSDSILIRTLWNSARYITGTHIEHWDGLLEDRTPAPANGSYHVKVLSHNVQYNWDGGRIGNTSSEFVGGDRFKNNLENPNCISIVGDKMYYGVGYSENFNGQFTVDLNDIGKRQLLLPFNNGTHQSSKVSCTDGVTVYWGGEIYRETVNNNVLYTNFIFATKVSDNSKVNFSSGTSFDGGYYSAISITPAANAYIRGMAVQKTGNYLFVARPGLNQLQVLNKTTGAFVRDISIAGVYSLATDNDNKLWVGTTAGPVTKYTVNGDGTLTSTGTIITGISNAVAMSVSPDNSTVVVADGGNGQNVIKGFNNSTGGAAMWTLGTPGGYATDATVTNYKFAFNPTSIAFQDDGSFWVVDGGNFRIQHYSASRQYINNIAYLGAYYQVHIDPNNKNRLYCESRGNFYEYALDYTKPIDNGQNGSWKLVKNWRTVSGSYLVPRGIPSITTFGGKTFGRFFNFNTGKDGVLELVEGGQMRPTKIEVNGTVDFLKNGDLIDNYTGYSIGVASGYKLYAFTGLDGDGDPTWASTPYKTIVGPVATSQDAISGVRGEQLSNNKIYYFQGNALSGSNSTGDEYHFSAFDVTTSQWKFKTSKGTNDWYRGDFPAKGEFDNGNGVSQAGAYITVSGDNVVWTYRGEFWKGAQTNYFNHYHSSGLFISQFGRWRDQYQNDIGNEGNMFSGSWVQETPDKAYLFSGGEYKQGGIHRWRIEGLNTIQLQNCTFNPLLNYTPPPSNLNLMAGLTHGALLNNSLGWTISHSNANATGNPTWFVQVGRKTPSKYGPQDVSAIYYQEGGADKIRTVTRSLGSNSGLNTWKLTGKISFDDCHISNTGGQGGACYFEILDNTGKTISRFNEEEASRHSGNSYVRGNNVDLHRYSNPAERQADAAKTQPFAIAHNNGTLTFQYATYAAITVQVAEAGADVTKPSTIRLRFTPGDYQKTISVAELSFQKDTTNHYRTNGSGNWGNLNIWQSSNDSITWNDATEAPNSVAKSITIRTGDTVDITAAAAVDQLIIQNGAAINVAPKASLWVNDGEGDDIRIVGSGKLTIQSDTSGSGRIGNSTGSINGNVIVENYIKSETNKAYRLLSPSVNTAGGPKPYIRDNWQEGQNNTTLLFNNNAVPYYGTHITGSLLGTNGFDATALATPSLLIYNQTAASPAWQPIANTNATNLEAKKGYLLYVRGDRSIDLQTNLLSSNTTLRATGTVLIGTQTYAGQEGNGRLSLIGNPYASPINWNTIITDATTANNTNFENYCTYWDPNMGESGGYVTISANGTKSTADKTATEIPSGQAFFIKAKAGVTAPTLTIKESHKSAVGNLSAFRTDAQAQFATSLHYSPLLPLLGRRIKADAVNAVFDNNLSAGVDGNDAEEIANDNENIALARGGKMLGIESRPLISVLDTLYLRTERLKVQVYEWQFQPMDFNRPDLKAYLEDKFLNTRTEIDFTDSAITVIPFLVTITPGSAATDRFRIVFATNSTLPVTLLSLKAFQKNTGVEVNWTTGNDDQIERYEVEKSNDLQQFTKVGTVMPQASGNTSNSYTLFDPYPKEGNNYYRIKKLHKDGTITYSGVVNVKIGSKKNGFELYPNPISGNNITLHLNNVSRGTYTISIFNITGQKIFSSAINHSGGSGSQTIQIKDLPPGNYNLQVVGNGISYNLKMIK
jgi:hypothetical protein